MQKSNSLNGTAGSGMPLPETTDGQNGSGGCDTQHRGSHQYIKVSTESDPDIREEAQRFLRRRRVGPIIPTVGVPTGGMSITESAKVLFASIAPKLELFIRSGKVTRM